MARILLVDDLPLVLEIVAKLLVKLNHQVQPVGEARDALALASGPGHFDLALIDLLLRGASGVELAKQIHALRPSLPIVMMSAHVDLVSAAALDSLRALGIDQVVLKPVGLVELDTAVRAALHKAR